MKKDWTLVMTMYLFDLYSEPDEFQMSKINKTIRECFFGLMFFQIFMMVLMGAFSLAQLEGGLETGKSIFFTLYLLSSIVINWKVNSDRKKYGFDVIEIEEEEVANIKRKIYGRVILETLGLFFIIFLFNLGAFLLCKGDYVLSLHLDPGIIALFFLFTYLRFAKARSSIQMYK